MIFPDDIDLKCQFKHSQGGLSPCAKHLESHSGVWRECTRLQLPQYFAFSIKTELHYTESFFTERFQTIEKNIASRICSGKNRQARSRNYKKVTNQSLGQKKVW